MIAARLNPRHQEDVREQIKASQLVNALENHVLKRKKMQPSQVTAALGLLKKCAKVCNEKSITENQWLTPTRPRVQFQKFRFLIKPH
ncbi:MAG: hypothetical protein A3H27_06605 [Acidobacteria bacterium RIFCSPLOWO2_02_FULL_59_13]|nr:MAG: hypothetical protein A3H27_06605 [Acidobacteria bacterium RIFCSPLOWO2_02_FULL_59_13]